MSAEQSPLATETRAVEPIAQRVYSTFQIGFAAFIGGPLAGCWFLAHNYRQFGKAAAAKQALLWGVGITIALILVSHFLLPDRFPHYVIPVAYSIILKTFAEMYQGGLISHHLSNGGRTGSWWRLIGVSLLCILIFLAIASGVFFLFPRDAN